MSSSHSVHCSLSLLSLQELRTSLARKEGEQKVFMWSSLSDLMILWLMLLEKTALEEVNSMALEAFTSF